MMVSSTLFLVLYLGLVVVLHGGYGPVQELIRLMGEMLPVGRLFRRRTGPQAAAFPGPIVASLNEKEPVL
jgi:hypothetical protein